MQNPQEDSAIVARLQQQLIQSLQQAGIRDTRLLDAFRRIPRHAFITEWYERVSASQTQQGIWQRYCIEEMEMARWLSKIYEDQPLVTRIDAYDAPCSSSSQPSIMAEMLEALDVQPGQNMLEIGTGTGYNAALLAELTGAPWLVTSMDIDCSLIEQAKRALQETVGPGMTLVVGNGREGYPPNAPYQRMIATASYPSVPPAWIEQLVSGGCLVMNLQRPLLNVILLIKKQGHYITGEITRCQGMFMKLHDGKGVEPPRRPGGLINPVIAKLTTGSFQPSNLAHKDFTFFLQCHLPLVMVYRMTHKEQWYTYLYDPETEQVIRFDQEVVRGSIQLWEKLCAIALEFQRLGMPARSAYTFEVTADGRQGFRLGEQFWQMA